MWGKCESCGFNSIFFSLWNKVNAWYLEIGTKGPFSLFFQNPTFVKQWQQPKLDIGVDQASFFFFGFAGSWFSGDGRRSVLMKLLSLLYNTTSEWRQLVSHCFKVVIRFMNRMEMKLNYLFSFIESVIMIFSAVLRCILSQ